MQHQQLLRRESQFSVGLAFIVREFDPVRARQDLNHGAYLATYEPMLRDIAKYGDDV